MRIDELMRTEPITIGEHDPLALALQLMRWNGVRHLPVMRGGRVIGMLGDRELLPRLQLDAAYHVDGTAAEAMSMAHKAPLHLDVADAAAMFIADEIDALVVVEEGRLLGIITSTDVLAHVAQCEIRPVPSEEPTVSTLMVRRLQAAYADDTLVEASSRMLQYGIRHLPIVDGLRRVIGILSERDVREGWLLASQDTESLQRVRQMRVAEVMTADPRTIREDEPLSTAARALLEDRFGALPVVDEDGRLLGVLSYVDLLRYLIVQLAEEEGARKQQGERVERAARAPSSRA